MPTKLFGDSDLVASGTHVHYELSGASAGIGRATISIWNAGAALNEDPTQRAMFVLRHDTLAREVVSQGRVDRSLEATAHLATIYVPNYLGIVANVLQSIRGRRAGIDSLLLVDLARGDAQFAAHLLPDRGDTVVVRVGTEELLATWDDAQLLNSLVLLPSMATGIDCRSPTPSVRRHAALIRAGQPKP